MSPGLREEAEKGAHLLGDLGCKLGDAGDEPGLGLLLNVWVLWGSSERQSGEVVEQQLPQVTQKQDAQCFDNQLEQVVFNCKFYMASSLFRELYASSI
jgi:hypothetical protein